MGECMCCFPCLGWRCHRGESPVRIPIRGEGFYWPCSSFGSAAPHCPKECQCGKTVFSSNTVNGALEHSPLKVNKLLYLKQLKVNVIRQKF